MATTILKENQKNIKTNAAKIKVRVYDDIENVTKETQKMLCLLNFDSKYFNVETLVFKTADYGFFKFMKGNRNICRNRVNKIKASISKYGYVRNPILINHKYEIVDGQHRFMALCELGYPIYFVLVNNDGCQLAYEMNQSQTGWNTPDFLESFAGLENENFVNLRNIVNNEKYKSVPIGTKLAVATKYYHNSCNGLSAKAIKLGLVVFPSDRVPQAIEKLDKALEVLDVMKERKIRGKKDLFLNAVIYLSTNGDEKNCFDFDQFLANLKMFRNIDFDKSSFENCMKFAIKIHNKNGEAKCCLAKSINAYNEKKALDVAFLKQKENALKAMKKEG